MSITKSFLREIFFERKRMVRDCERLREMRARATCIPSSSDIKPDKVQKSPSNRAGIWIDMATDLERELTERDAELKKKQSAALEWIRTVTDIMAREILIMRYLEGMEWSMIADQLQYSVRRVHQVHSAAISELPDA